MYNDAAIVPGTSRDIALLTEEIFVRNAVQDFQTLRIE